jgi:hypothetical protein
MRGNAWLTSLRRHYPHQVQGVVHFQTSDLSAIRLPRNSYYAKAKLKSRKWKLKSEESDYLDMKRWVILLVAFCALAGATLPAANAPQRKRFLWRIVNTPAPFFLVGSMHALRESDYYVLADFDQAIDQSQKFIFERDPEKNDTTLLWRKLQTHATYPRGVTIQQRVRPSTFALLKHIAHIPLGSYQAQKPWAIAVFNLKAQGMETVQSRWSVDRYVLRTRHRSETGGLETIDEFVRTFAEMDDREGESFLLQAIEYGQRSPELLNETIAAWKAGDTNRMYRLYAARKSGSDGYWRWIERRSALWIPRIERAIKSRQPTMVTVGALHLCGPRGVIAELKKRGYKFEQL